MALAPYDTSATHTLTTLDASHRQALRALLERDITHNIFALSWLENYGIAPTRQGMFHFRGILNSRGGLDAMALVISDRLILIEALSPEQAGFMGSWYCEAAFHFQHVVSAQHLVSAFWASYTSSSQHTAQQPFTSRLIASQKMYDLPRKRWLDVRQSAVEQAENPVPLREATILELEAVFLASARMHLEETQEDPLAHQPDVFRHHVKHRIQAGRTYVWFDQHRRLVFKADLSAQSRYGVQISGVYTDPAVRNQGIATRAMTELCRLLFVRGWPRATLYVNHSNHAAIKVYERVGFSFHHDYMTVFVAQ